MMFKSNVIEPLTEPDDIKMSTVLLDLWTSFAANGSFFFTILLMLSLLLIMVLIFTGYQKVNK